MIFAAAEPAAKKPNTVQAALIFEALKRWLDLVA
jgi:hypothetical protein